MVAKNNQSIHNKRVILIIEPDKDVAAIFAHYLERAEHLCVELAHSAEEAIRRADKKRPDAVVLELAMSENNGVAFLHEFRSDEDWQSVPVIIQTHLPIRKYIGQKDFAQLNIADYLYKPTTSLADLLRSLNRVLGNSV